MNDYIKGLFFISILILFGFVSNVSAYSYNTYTDRDSFYYNENVNGQSGGFNIQFSDTDSFIDKNYNYNQRGYYNCGDYYSWRSYGCNKYQVYGNRPYYSDPYNGLDHDAVLKEAFKTYQQSSKQQYQLEAKRIALEERRRYSYGGYGYGYSGARYYSYGW